MNVRLLIGTNAYACITTEARSLDVLLHAGKSASKSLRETATDWRIEAARLVMRAELAELAAIELEQRS